jgi:membrane-anchored protein YejM (alkaline phosphatase superfamily)
MHTKRLLSLAGIIKRPGDAVTGNLVLWAVFCAAYVPLNLFFISDILKSKYKFIYKIHAFSAILIHCVLIAGIMALLFMLLRKRRPAVRAVIFSVCTVGIFAITLIDLTLFKIYSFHINGYIISEVMQPEFAESSGIGARFIIITAIKLVLTAAAVAVAARLILALTNRPMRAKRGFFLTVKIIVIAVIAEKIFMTAVAFNRPAYIFRLAESIPVVYVNPADYIYVGMKKIAEVKDEKETFAEPLAGSENIQYPRNGIYPNVRIPKSKNIIIIATESTRSDFITKETTPHIWNIAHGRNGSMAQNHFSSSNSTHMGIFSILYGINPCYSGYIKSVRAESVPVKILRSNGFSTHLFMSAPTEWHKMNYYLDQNFDTQFHPQTKESDTRDREICDAVIRKLDNPSDKPFMMFVFFDSSHYPFYSPEKYWKFSPHIVGYFKSFDFLYLETIREPLMNSYRNSLYYLDTLIGEIDAALARSGKRDDTILFITGDHGCEFGESGKYFYSSSFNNYSTKVPLVIRAPGFTAASPVSGHEDILPTALDIMGVKDSGGDVEGIPVNTANTGRYAIIAFQDAITPYRYQIVDDKGKLEVDFKSTSFISGKFDADDKPVSSLSDQTARLSAIRKSINFFNKSKPQGSSAQ